MDTFECPMVYPYLTEDSSLRQKLIENKIFVATYWPNVMKWEHKGFWETNLAECLIPIPCDQRYGKDNMNIIVKLINKG